MTLKVDDKFDNVVSVGSIFKGDVRSSLPYMEIVTLADYRYEERILGLKVCPGIVVRVVSVIKFSFSYRLAKKTRRRA